MAISNEKWEVSFPIKANIHTLNNVVILFAHATYCCINLFKYKEHTSDKLFNFP
jgi:hypothetical protein